MTKKKDPSLTKSEALQKAWKKRKDYKDYDRSRGSMYNSWRSKIYTKKGQEAGFPDSWKTFKGFKENIPDGWEKGKVLIRKNNNKPFSKENSEWVRKEDQGKYSWTKFEYQGEEKFLYEWAYEFDLNLNGLKQRYHKGKNYTKEQILFGKRRAKQREIKDIEDLDTQQEKRTKASKMLNQYKLKDNKKGFNYNLDIDFLLEAMKKSCVYCGNQKKIGLDRIDNDKGHIKENCVSCCYRCNITRGDQFSYEEMIRLGKTIKEIDNDRTKKD